MVFVPYPSIENSYRNKFIEYWKKYYPELSDIQYSITEKIHGSNFCVLVSPNAPYRYFSRNQEIIPPDKFHDFQSALREPIISASLQLLQSDADKNGEEIRVYGELFGKGIQKGVNYNFSGKVFRIFDMKIGKRWVTQEELFEGYPLLSDAKVPFLGVSDNLEQALSYDVERSTTYNTVDGGIWEGIVIKPYSKVYESPEGSLFYLKKKSEKFEEKAKEREPKAQDTEVDSVNEIFLSYFNENRVQSYFSKFGEIEHPKQMPDYIKGILEDGKIDFLKDHSGKLEKLGKDQVKKALNIGSTIANMLKVYL